MPSLNPSRLFQPADQPIGWYKKEVKTLTRRGIAEVRLYPELPREDAKRCLLSDRGDEAAIFHAAVALIFTACGAEGIRTDGHRTMLLRLLGDADEFETRESCHGAD